MSTIGAYFRLVRVGWVLVREGVVSALPTQDMPPSLSLLKALTEPFARLRAKREARSIRLSRAVGRLGAGHLTTPAPVGAAPTRTDLGCHPPPPTSVSERFILPCSSLNTR